MRPEAIHLRYEVEEHLVQRCPDRARFVELLVAERPRLAVATDSAAARSFTVRITGADTDAPTASPLNSRTWGALNGVWASSSTNAWAVGARGTVRHYTGDETNWDVVGDVPTDVNLNAVWGTSPSDVWAVGDAAVVLHFDGSAWRRVKVAGLGDRRPELVTVWAAEAGQVWIGGHGVVLALGGTP